MYFNKLIINNHLIPNIFLYIFHIYLCITYIFKKLNDNVNTYVKIHLNTFF